MNKRMEPDYPSQDILSEILIVSRMPVVIWISLIYLFTFIMQNWHQLRLVSSLFFTLVIAVHLLLYWFSNIVTQYSRWSYVVVQAALICIVSSSAILPEGSPAILAGSLPILIAQCVPIFQKTIKVSIVFLLLFAFFIGLSFIYNKGPVNWLMNFAVLSFIMTMIIFYSISYNRQVEARVRMEYYASKLHSAYAQVEELTLINERQRMARDLHDTLAQGLAGLIMQLEAMDAHLKKGNVTRTMEIIHISMAQARDALKDARKAIDNLRETASESPSFHQAALNMIQRFEQANAMVIERQIAPIPALSSYIAENSLYMLGECLANVAKHSGTTRAKVSIGASDGKLRMIIEDNGRGFQVKSIGKQTGKYGLIGLKERSQLIGGALTIDSIPGSGTKVAVSIPL